ncbi:Retrovirus-related Pol polyprotein from transposon TNT 1-94 [Eumeta japonica]|uniref:Retrovirus-related Pol polyprotein from transposon TNT 1-94 n=1 Tax=Eumeta variegata TaxID=151549 RepID=A0A4C1WIX8_EUMVA|nr:Retrovirus-related Pol polyprotein from transposon TNT 1-94 [Eumeta japonica]
MATNSFLTSIPKLKGRENYDEWAFAAENLLILEGVADCIKQERSAATAVAEDAKAKAKLILTIDPSLYVHIKEAGSTKDLWQKLKSMFDDSGFSRRITLLRNLISIHLDGCDSMTTYITQIIETAQKLAGTGFPVNDEWIGCLLLAGLPDKYFPMIMAIEHSGIAITADVIKTKLIDLSGDSSEAGNAFFSRGQHYRQHRNVGNKEKNDSSRSNNGAAGGGTSSSNKKKTDKQRINVISAKNSGITSLSAPRNKTSNIGASVHMTPNVNIVKNPCFTPQLKEIIAANKSAMPVLCCGDVNINTKTDGCRYDVTLKEVSCVPNLSTSLISISQLIKKGNSVQFKNNCCYIYNVQNSLVGIADEMNGVYKLRLESKQCLLTSTIEDTSSEVWHRRMGHLNMNDLKKMRNGAVTGISYSDKSEISKSTCTVCCEGKQSRLPFGHAGTRSSKPLDVIHADVCGPMEITSIGGSRDVIVHENTERKNIVDDSITVSVGDTIQNDKSGSYVESSEKEIAKKTSQNDECSNISSESEYLNALTDLDSTLKQTTASEEDDEPEPEVITKRIRKPPERYGFTNQCASSSTEVIKDPVTIHEALEGPDRDKWIEAMKEELEAFKENDAWFPVDKLPSHKTPVQCKWVYKKKVNSDNSVRYRARLVAKGFTQKPGLDYEETFSPVLMPQIGATFEVYLFTAMPSELKYDEDICRCVSKFRYSLACFFCSSFTAIFNLVGNIRG